jgi:N-acetylglucosaminyldiphosphoundecaprenol N-acetyl-beta-D-mannosaminyltransferase
VLLEDLLRRRRKWSLHWQERVGKQRKPFRIPTLPTPDDAPRRLRLGAKALALWPLLTGKMRLVGPRPLRPEELKGISADSPRLQVEPGILSAYRARQLANVAFDDENSIEEEYARGRSLRRDANLLLSAAMGWLLHRPEEASEHELELAQVPIARISTREAIERIVGYLDQPTPRFVAFVNAHCANLAWTRRDYREVLQTADLVLADGIGVRLASVLHQRPVPENVNGTDLLPRLLPRLAGRRLYLLGAAPGVAVEVARRLRQQHPELVLVGARSGYFKPEEERQVVQDIAESGAELLLVAMGVPAQEMFIARNLHRLNVRVAIGVGGLFDFVAERIPRAPIWMRELGLEWVYRLVQEPQRMWRRYLLGNVSFMARALRERRARRSTGGLR